jgi:hypothetical protein
MGRSADRVTGSHLVPTTAQDLLRSVRRWESVAIPMASQAWSLQTDGTINADN